MSDNSNRLSFMLLMSLAASKRLRRIWLWGSIIIIVASIPIGILGFYVRAQSPTAESPLGTSLLIVGLTGFFVSWGGLLLWIHAHIIRFFAKKVKDDYRDDELFEL